MALHGSDQRAFAERPVDDDGDAPIACERKNAGFDVALDRAIGDLNEVERMAAHDRLDLLVPPALRRRHADIAHFASGLHREERRQVLLPRKEIVDRDQVEAGDIPPLPRFRDLRAPARTGGDPNLVGGKKTRRPA